MAAWRSGLDIAFVSGKKALGSNPAKVCRENISMLLYIIDLKWIGLCLLKRRNKGIGPEIKF
jgi:hypothetical protein